MSSTSYSNPPRSSPEPQASLSTPAMASQGSSQGSMLRRTRPSQVYTTLQANGIPNSAISASSVASSSRHDSPFMSPENMVLTTNSSIQPSPEPYRGRDVDLFSPTPFALGDPLLSRKPSSNSMNPSLTPSNGSSLAEALQNQSSNGQSLIRRLSSRTQKLVSRTRRQSSVAPKSRDGSIGPAVIRRRSDSTNTAPPPDTLFFTDSDDDFITDERDELNPFAFVDTQLRDMSSTSNPGSVAGSASPIDPPSGPVIPLALIKGTYVRKISKKRKYKRIFLVLDSEAAKITWDKNRPSKCIYIDDIKEIRIGSDTRQYRLDYDVPASEEGRFFSILHAVADKSKSKVMHLVAEDEETFDNWVTALDAISKHRQDLMASLMSFNDKAIRAYWNNEMIKQSDGKPRIDEEEIDMPGVERVCRNLHIHVAPKELQTKFAIADATRTGRLNFAAFQVFVREMKRREDIRAIYRGIASDCAAGITWSEFATFLRDTQGEDVDSDARAWEAKFAKFARRPKSKDSELADVEDESPRMSEQALAAYLTSTFNVPLAPQPASYPLDQPMNEYFISSSHNTYLLGRQVADTSSVEGYITALVKGCRSIEIDCWDGSGGQPLVQHGFALTNAIHFREVINVVNKYAFVTSHFPLWISLEVHCNPAQQEIMSDIIKEVFGPRLVLVPLDPDSDKLPSPSELKDRILVKVKAASPEEPRTGRLPSVGGRPRGNSLNSPYSPPVALDNASIPAQFLSQSPLLSPRDPSRRRVGKRYNTITEGEVQEAVSSSTSDCDSGNEKTPKKEKEKEKTKQSKIVPALGDLGVYCTGVSFNGFAALECKMPYHILSFMEGTFRSNTKSKEYKDALYRHNMRYMMRVYPQYSRISSHNFDPLMYWRKGVQMAALNWQTFDFGMQLNQAMFDGGTDQSGYVLKPHSMREIRLLPNGLPEEAIGKLERKNVTFSIDVISAQQLMRPANLPSNRSVDPYVEVEVFHANDKRDKHDSSVGIPTPMDSPLKQWTRVVKENGFNPIFDKKLKFNITTKYPELIFIRWSVKLSSNGESINDRAPMATYTAKLANLKQGYRTLPLLDPNGDRYLFSTLFCRIDVGPVTAVYVNPGTNTEPVGKLKTLGNKVFNRSSNNSNNNANNNININNNNNNNTTKMTSEKSVEKSSLDSGYSDHPQQPLTRPV